MTHDEMIAVIQAHKDEKSIQCKCRDSVVNDTWHDSPTPVWNFGGFDYRVKPEPREWWFNEYQTDDKPWYGSAFTDKPVAERAGGDLPRKLIHVREVID